MEEGRMASVKLTTKRVMVRELSESDWEDVHAYASDSEVVKFLPWGPNSEQDTHDHIKRAMITRLEDPPRQAYHLGLVLKATGKLIGGCGIQIADPDHLQAWIGYVMHRDYWGQGFGKEGAAALVEFGFRELKMHRISGKCDVQNIAAICVMEKLGMQREGHFREHKFMKGRWRDSYVYAILDREWPQDEEATSESSSL